MLFWQWPQRQLEWVSNRLVGISLSGLNLLDVIIIHRSNIVSRGLTWLTVSKDRVFTQNYITIPLEVALCWHAWPQSVFKLGVRTEDFLENIGEIEILAQIICGLLWNSVWILNCNRRCVLSTRRIWWRCRRFNKARGRRSKSTADS